MRTLLRGLFVGLLFDGAARPEQAKDGRAEMERLQKSIERLAGPEVRREIDPAALAAHLGNDLDKIFALVRGLDFHPYRGSLRGALGTLLAGAGNDVDRCLLLKDLLERGQGKPKLRFCSAQIGKDLAATLAARCLASMPMRAGVTAEEQEDPVLRQESPEDLTGAPVESALKSAIPHLLLVGSGFAADRATLEKSMEGAGAALAGRRQDGVEAVADGLRDHVWLQVEREGRWVDLDPSFAEAAVGWAPVAEGRPLEALPPELNHSLGLRLIVERLAGDKLESEVIYAGKRATSDLAGAVLNVSVLPADFHIEKFNGPLLRQADRFEKFQPTIAWGGHTENARVFDVKGKVFQSKDGKFGGDSGAVVGDRIFGQLGRAPAGSLLGVRMELEVGAPGEAPHVEVRYLLDRAKPGTRDSGKPQVEADDKRFRLALFQSWTFWPAIGTVGDAFLIDRLAGTLARNGGIPALLLDHVQGRKRAEPKEVAARMDPLPLGLIGLVREGLAMAHAEFEAGSGLLFADRASLLAWKEAIVPRARNEVGWRGGFDLLYAPVGAVAKDPVAAARARRTYGLLLSEEESARMEAHGVPVFSAAAVFRKAREGNVPTVVLRGKADGVTLPAGSAKLVQRELDAGRTIVIPASAVEIGGRKVTAWWRLDPASGDCLGVGDTGEGQAVSEGVLILDNISIPMVRRCMKFVVCLNIGVGLGGQSMQNAGRECMTDFMKDFVKETLDGAIKEFVPQVIRDPKGYAKGKVVEALEADLKREMKPEYWKLYQLAKQYYKSTSGKCKSLSSRVEILLVMGNKIAKYAHEQAEEARNNR